MKTAIIILNCLLFMSTTAQTIEKFSVDSGGASASAGNIEILYTIGEVNIQELSAGNVQVSEGFINAELKILIDPQVFLQGPLINPTVADQMNDDLRAASYIPTTSPYADAATCNASVFNVKGTNAIVDWIWIELRDKNDNTSVVASQSALLQRDGDIVDTNGVSHVNLNVVADDYYVVVNHRNHLGIMTKNPIEIAFSSTPSFIDFTDINTQTYGTHAQVQLPSGDMALWAGDANGDGLVNFSDDINSTLVDIIFFPANLSFSSSYDFVDGYFQSDILLDGNVSFSNEINQLLASIILYPLNTSFSSQYNLFLEQLPSPSNLRNASQRRKEQIRQDRTKEILNN